MLPLPQARRAKAVNEDKLRFGSGGGRTPEVDGGGGVSSSVDFHRLRGESGGFSRAVEEAAEQGDNAETAHSRFVVINWRTRGTLIKPLVYIYIYREN